MSGHIPVTRVLTHITAGGEVEKLANLVAAYSADNTLGNIDDAVNVLSVIVGGAHS